MLIVTSSPPCLLWVISGHCNQFAQCPLYSQKQTLELSRVMSALCQKQQSAVNFAKYDVERAEYRRDIGEHVSASQKIHCPQVWV
jgi:hypothetical protein